MVPRCVLLADRHPTMLAAVHRLLQPTFGATIMVADEASLHEAVTHLAPDLVVVDQSLPASGGVNIVCSLLERHPGLRVIVLSVYDEPAAVAQMLRAGAAGFILKRTASSDLTVAVSAVLRGEIYVSPDLGWTGNVL